MILKMNLFHLICLSLFVLVSLSIIGNKFGLPQSGTVYAASETPSSLPVPPGDANVPKPAGDPGNLTVVNWAGFKGAFSYTFDDANSSVIAHYPELNALGVHMTFYLQTNKPEAADKIWAQALKDGHELGNHTINHPQTGTEKEIDGCTAFIQQHFGVTPLTMAAPFGDLSYVDLAKSRFLFNRGVVSSSIKPGDNTDPYNLPCYGPSLGAKAKEMTFPATMARKTGTWRIYLIHGFTGGTDGAYMPVDIEEFVKSVNEVKAFGDMWLDSLINTGSYWLAQKIFMSLTPTTSGKNIIYKWTLPPHFPTGKYLRVTTSGGVLKQKGKVLQWDNHGYYEVALDAGELTIAKK